MLRNVQNYTSALDFDVDTLAGTVEFPLPQQASPGVTSPGGASPTGISPAGVTPEGSSSTPAPTPFSAAPRATNGHANGSTVGVTPAVTHSRAANLLPVPVATRYGGDHNNNRATLAELFEVDTLQPLRELELGPPYYAEDIAHQAQNDSFNLEYAYVATNALGSFSGGDNKEQIPNTFKEAMILPQAARWKVVVVVVYLTLTDPLRIQPWSQDRRHQTK